jgi:hypothetical protein
MDALDYTWPHDPDQLYPHDEVDFLCDLDDLDFSEERAVVETAHSDRSRKLRLFALVMAVCMLVSFIGSLGILGEVLGLNKAQATALETLPIAGTERYDLAFEVLDLINVERTAAELPELAMNADFMAAAMLRTRECQVRFSHTRPDGQSCFTALPRVNAASGENIAAGQMSAAQVMRDWMRSEGHRENILKSNFYSVGIGCFECTNAAGQRVLSWSQEFSSLVSVNAEIPENVTGVWQVSVDSKAPALMRSIPGTTYQPW